MNGLDPEGVLWVRTLLTSTFDPTATSLGGLLLVQLIVAILGVLLMNGEYSTGAIADASTWHSLANGWRTTGDIECYSCWSAGIHSTNPDRTPLTDWANVSVRFNSAAAWAPDVGPGGWNDFDSLEVGNSSNDGLTVPERQSTMTLWSMADSR